jgi:hypothetical protein
MCRGTVGELLETDIDECMQITQQSINPLQANPIVLHLSTSAQNIQPQSPRRFVQYSLCFVIMLCILILFIYIVVNSIKNDQN